MENNPLPPILIVGNFLSVFGSNQGVCEDLAEHFRFCGHTVLTSSDRKGRIFRLMDMLITILHKNSQYRVAQVDVYSGLAFLWAEASCFLLRCLKKPYILALRGGSLPIFLKRSPGRVKRLLKSATVVTAPSHYLQENMRRYREDIVLLPNALDIEKYPFRLRSISNPHLVWLRAFHNIYNPQMAPSVIANLYQSFPQINLTMIGPDKGDGTLQQTQIQIEKLGLQRSIEIITGIPKAQVPGALANSNIFINTTNVDNTPVSVMEAMACGLCIVSTNVGGVPYLLDDGQDALLVPPDDPDAMAAAVRRILTEPGLAERLSSNTRRKAERFDWSAILPQWQSLFLEAANRN